MPDTHVRQGSGDDPARLHAMLSVSPVAVAFLDLRLRYTRVTPALAALHGVALPEAEQRSLMELFSEGDRERAQQLLAEVVASRTPASGFEVTSTGTPPRHLVCCFFPVGIAGEVVGLGAILVDDTERRRLDQLARLRTLELEAVLASIPEGVYVGDAGGVRIASRRALQMLGFDTPADLNRPVEVLMRELDVRTLDGGPQPPEENVFVRALQGEGARQEFLLRPRGASAHLIIESSAAPIRGDDGILGAVAVNIDVSERRRLERELRTQRELAVLERDVLALLGEGAPQDKVLGALALGLERVCGGGLLASVLTVENGTIRHVAAPSLPPAWCATIEGEAIGPQAGSCGTAAFRKQRVVVTDVETDPLWERFRDAARPFGLRACWSHPICATDGDALGTVALYYRQPRAPAQAELDAIAGCARVARIVLERHRDEAVRQRLHEELRDTLRLNEMLMGIVGHDLRNPLQAVISGTELAQKSTDPARQQRALERVHASARRMGSMIGQILDLTRARQAGGISVEREHTDLAQMVRNVASEVELAFPTRRLQLELSGDTSGHWDGVRMSQVLTNLLCNAMQHGDPAKPVALRVAGEPEAVKVRIENGGVIPPERLSRLFTAFGPSGSRAAGGQGLGLGLFISQQIVVAHGGHIDVTSQEPDGTRFEIVLPRAPELATGERGRGAPAGK